MKGPELKHVKVGSTFSSFNATPAKKYHQLNIIIIVWLVLFDDIGLIPSL